MAERDLDRAIARTPMGNYLLYQEGNPEMSEEKKFSAFLTSFFGGQRREEKEILVLTSWLSKGIPGREVNLEKAVACIQKYLSDQKLRKETSPYEMYTDGFVDLLETEPDFVDKYAASFKKSLVEKTLLDAEDALVKVLEGNAVEVVDKQQIKGDLLVFFCDYVQRKYSVEVKSLDEVMKYFPKFPEFIKFLSDFSSEMNGYLRRVLQGQVMKDWFQFFQVSPEEQQLCEKERPKYERGIINMQKDLLKAAKEIRERGIDGFDGDPEWLAKMLERFSEDLSKLVEVVLEEVTCGREKELFARKFLEQIKRGKIFDRIKWKTLREDVAGEYIGGGSVSVDLEKLNFDFEDFEGDYQKFVAIFIHEIFGHGLFEKSKYGWSIEEKLFEEAFSEILAQYFCGKLGYKMELGQHYEERVEVVERLLEHSSFPELFDLYMKGNIWKIDRVLRGFSEEEKTQIKRILFEDDERYSEEALLDFFKENRKDLRPEQLRQVVSLLGNDVSMGEKWRTFVFKRNGQINYVNLKKIFPNLRDLKGEILHELYRRIPDIRAKKLLKYLESIGK